MFLVILPFPGTVALRLLLLFTCFGIAMRNWYLDPSVRVAIPARIPIVFWLTVSFASLLYSVDPTYSAGELKNELGYTMIAFGAFFAIARNSSLCVLVLRAAVVGLLLIGGWAFLAWLGNGFVWDEGGRFGGTGVFATYLVTLLPALVYLAQEDPAQAIRKMTWGLIGFLLGLALLCMQRAIWPAFAAQGLVALYMLRYRKGAAIFARWRLGLGILVILLAAGALQVSQQIRYKGLASDADRTTLSADVRYDFWPKVADKILEHPLTGAGFGRQVMRKAYPELVPGDYTLLWHAHNMVLNYGLTAGLPGVFAVLVLFAGLGGAFWRFARECGSAAGTAGLMLVVGVLVRNQFNDFFVRDMSLMFWAYVGLFMRRAMVESEQGRVQCA